MKTMPMTLKPSRTPAFLRPARGGGIGEAIGRVALRLWLRARGVRCQLVRSAEELARSEGAIATFVAKHPGARADQIAREMGVPTKDLALPIKKLLSRGELSTQGQKRATRYFAGKKR